MSLVVENFKVKTNELFHEISEMNPAEVEETVKCHVQAQLDEYGIDAEIVDVAVVGSRCRGLEQEGPDLDILEYIPDIKGNRQAMEGGSGACGETAGNGDRRQHERGI